MDSQSDNNKDQKSKSTDEILEYIVSNEYKELKLKFPIPSPKDSSKS